MRRNRMFVVLLAVVTILAMATAALAAQPEGRGKPKPPPDIWTCADRVENGAVWVPGAWNGTSYVSEFDPNEDVGVPLCIDLDEISTHKDVVNWTISWTGSARKDPKGLMFIFEEEVHAAHYADLEMLSSVEGDITSRTVEMELNFGLDDDGTVEHLVFLAMPHNSDKWTHITFTVTPNP